MSWKGTSNHIIMWVLGLVKVGGSDIQISMVRQFSKCTRASGVLVRASNEVINVFDICEPVRKGAIYINFFEMDVEGKFCAHAQFNTVM